MTKDELSTYYANLLILQYLKKPKAYATVKMLSEPTIMEFVPEAIEFAFDPETATGAQLDIIGKYVGISRFGTGLDGAITLSDEDFRKLLKLIGIRNGSESSLAVIQELLAANFPGQIYVSDNQTMGLSYVLVESLGTNDLLEIIVLGKYLPKPMGVQISVVVVPEQVEPYFGFDNSEGTSPGFAPFNSAQFYNEATIWLDANEVS